MRIESSELTMKASHIAVRREEWQQRWRAWNGTAGTTPRSALAASGATQVDISQSARMRLDYSIDARESANATSEIDDAAGDPFIVLIKRMIEMLTGVSMRTFSRAELAPHRAPDQAPRQAPPVPDAVAPAAVGPGGAGARVEARYVREEYEALHFAAEGKIRTSDGQEIAFKLDLQMERQYRETREIRIDQGAAPRRDPLVLDFGGTAAQLTDSRFRFDLDGDGSAESLPGLGAGLGFLVFDRNGNGRIDAGNELFGPATNDGFAELALLDSVRNGLLDENDATFTQLGVWRPDPDADGNDRTGGRYLSLKDAGIGALGLARLTTPFILRSATAENGAVRETGVYLRENGQAGLLQMIDISI